MAMADNKKQTTMWLAVGASAIVLIILVIWVVVKNRPVQQPLIGDTNTPAGRAELVTDSSELTSTDVNPAVTPRPALSDVIRAASTWRPGFTSWFGRMAPDLTLTDINAEQHKLADCRGKDVIIIFWATWCGPCLKEIPHLIDIRNTISEDKLVMLAISNEGPDTVKNFASRQNLNYTVISSSDPLPAPFSEIKYIPSSFFIDAQGRIKLATVGMLSAGEVKSILQAQ